MLLHFVNFQFFSVPRHSQLIPYPSPPHKHSSTTSAYTECATTFCAPTSPPLTKRPSSATLSPKWTARTRTSTGPRTTISTRRPLPVPCPHKPPPQQLPQLRHRIERAAAVDGHVAHSAGAGHKSSTTTMNTMRIITTKKLPNGAASKGHDPAAPFSPSTTTSTLTICHRSACLPQHRTTTTTTGGWSGHGSRRDVAPITTIAGHSMRIAGGRRMSGGALMTAARIGRTPTRIDRGDRQLEEPIASQ